MPSDAVSPRVLRMSISDLISLNHGVSLNQSRYLLDGLKKTVGLEITLYRPGNPSQENSQQGNA